MKKPAAPAVSAAEQHVHAMNRRHFLRGLGACIALPSLASLGPSRVLAAEAAQNGSAPEKPLSMPCLPLYGIVGSLVRFVQRQRPCWHRFRREGPPAAKGRGERGGGRSKAAGREPRQPEGEPGQSRPLPPSTQSRNQPWRRRRRRAETPAKPRPAKPIAQVEGSGTATALTVIM